MKDEKALFMRQAIAAAMEKSHREIPHYYLETEIPLDAALSWLARENARRAPPDRLLPVVLFLKAVALAAVKFPEMNGLYVDGGFRPAEAVHTGVVIALRGGGLLAPALHDVQAKPLSDLARGLTDLVTRVRSGRLRGSELTDPTITVTSLGDEGCDRVFGIIYPPQVALVGFGTIREAAVSEKGQVVSRRIVSASLAADHRVSDGLKGAAFLNAIAKALQFPQDLEAGR
ncbi:MAG TPA: 2-oxo acid dehydrogenase subunit E2 [bacterium]|nr:2-oxo acid dehydrogenase subunit E2 [bacterium]